MKILLALGLWQFPETSVLLTGKTLNWLKLVLALALEYIHERALRMHKLFNCCYRNIILLILLVNTGLADEVAGSGSLRILVYGASGKVGSRIVDEALGRGHYVTAVSRHPESITLVDENLAVVKGDILDPESVALLVTDQDVIIDSVRGVVGDSNDPRDAVSYLAAENVVAALRERGAGRLIHIGGSGSLEVKPGTLYADTLPKAFLPRELETEIAGQVMVLDYLRTVHDVQWTYATPAKYFTNGKRTGTFRIGGDQLLKDSHGRSRISRADFAVAVIDEAEQAKYIQQRFSVVY